MGEPGATVSPARDGALPPGPPPVRQAELRIPGRLDQLGVASEWLARFADAVALPDEMRYRLDLGLNEAVTNVVSYGYRDAGEHAIRLRLSTDGDAVTLEIEDDGVPFDPLAATPPARPASLAEAPIGGLGIQLIRAMLDECRYRREEGRNRLTLVARPRPGPGQTP